MMSRERNGQRGFAIGLILAIGIATTIATGGNGSDDGPMPTPPPPPPDNGPTLTITTDIAHEVATALIIAIGISFDVGEQWTDESGPAGDGPSCAIGGSVTITEDRADPETLTPGDQITAVFDNCDDGDGEVISGRVDLTVEDVQGNLAGETFLLMIEIVLTDLQVTAGGETATADGDVTLTLDSLNYPLITQRLAGDELRLGSDGATVSLTSFNHYIEYDTGMDPETLLVEAQGRLQSQLLGGSVDYETTLPVQAVGDNDPYTGVILITGAADATIRVVIVDSTMVTLEVDVDGDGNVDETIDTNFAALNGRTSTITSSTAPVIAREVYQGLTGFGSVAVTAGSQFLPVAPFGQLKLQAISGGFEALEVNCASSGTASVSGFIGTAGTFSANDTLSATLADCARGGEILNGQLDFAVASFEEAPGDAYLVTGAVTQNGLERNAGGATYSGTGTFDSSYDRLFTAQGLTHMSASALSFTVTSGGIDRTLSSATVDAEILSGPPPVTVVRTSNGSITSPLLEGSFDYQSITPDSFLFDADPATGPFSGELLVTASDGSVLRIVAVDDINVRLEIDYEGDTVIDVEINTTWMELQS